MLSRLGLYPLLYIEGSMNLNNCFRVSEKEISEISYYLAKLGKSLHGVTLYFCNDFDTENGTLGTFTTVHPDSIFIANLGDLKRITPTIVHELTHRKQYMAFGLVIYSLLLLPLIRYLYLEPQAKRAELKSERDLGITL